MVKNKIEVRIITRDTLNFEYQKITTPGTRIIAAKLDREFGLPSVPIIPFVFESHLKISNLKYCKQAYILVPIPAETIPFNNKSRFSILIIIDEAISTTIAARNVIKPKPLPILPKINWSIGEVLINKIKLPSINKSSAIAAKILLYRLAKITFIFLKVIGIKNNAKQKAIIAFGTINESLFKPGVIASVMVTTARITIVAMRFLFLISNAPPPF